jgi:hypothetical protein
LTSTASTTLLAVRQEQSEMAALHSSGRSQREGGGPSEKRMVGKLHGVSPVCIEKSQSLPDGIDRP